jgi:hypothetical protein
LFCFVSFSFHFISSHFISFHLISFHFISLFSKRSLHFIFLCHATTSTNCFEQLATRIYVRFFFWEYNSNIEYFIFMIHLSFCMNTYNIYSIRVWITIASFVFRLSSFIFHL